MTQHGLITRRVLLKDMGKAGLAVMILGTAACASRSEEGTSVAGATSTSAGAVTPTTAATTTTEARDATSTTTLAGTGHAWHRVDLEFVSAYLLYRGGEVALVDTGVGGSGAAIEAGLAEIGLGWDAVAHVIITHEHPDHQGGVAEVLAAVDAPWYAGAGDLGSITAPVAGTAVGDGDGVFDLEIIDTPGHTPGHISVLDRVGGVLVAGDALNGANGGVVGPNPQFTPDMEQANASMAKLAGFDYEVALFGHGEPVLSGASAMVAELADG